MFASLENSLTALAYVIPLPLFVFIASAVEEIIAPIPSPFVMLVGGSLASVQGYALPGLILLALCGALGKTLGALGVYAIVRKAEEATLPRLERYFGVTEAHIAALGAKLGRGSRDYLVLTLLRAFPFMPSVVVSVGSGLVGVPMRLYIVSTFIGTIVRDSIYLYAGYVGAALLMTYIGHAERASTLIEIITLALVAYVLIRLYRKHRVRN